jgi:ABC-type nitrate/sulfonate/bicarbonate transport system permease component
VKHHAPWVLLTVIILWCILTFGKVIDPLFLPNPIDVIKDLMGSIISGTVLKDVAATVYRLLVGFSIGAILGIPIGLLMGYSRKIYDGLEAIVEVSRAIPVVALFPLFLILFGLGDTSKFGIAAWSSSFIILINTMYGVHHSSQTRQMAARSLQASEWQIFWRVVLPDATPEIAVGLRTGISIALIVVIMSEMFLGTHYGLGQMIYNAHLMYDIPRMYTGIIASGVLGYGVNLILIFGQRKLIHWRRVS